MSDSAQEREHAFCSPSGYDGWSVCAGKPALEEGEPDHPNSASAAGTRIHAALAAHLIHGDALTDKEVQLAHALTEEDLEIALECLRLLKMRIDAYRGAGARVYLRAEERVDISKTTTEEGAKGSLDVAIVAQWSNRTTLEVVDYKTGYVEVDAEENGQLSLYAVASLEEEWCPENVTSVVLTVLQPKSDLPVKEWLTTPEWLREFAERTRPLAQRALALRGLMDAYTALVPGDKQCRYCRAAWKCPELARKVQKEAMGDFDALLQPMTPAQIANVLSNAYTALPVVEAWTKAVRARALMAIVNEKIPVEGLKPVQGKMGPRQWKENADRVLKAASIPDIYEPPKLKSPTQLEKVIKARFPTLWEGIQNFITQKPGRVSVALESDKRPRYEGEATLDDFEDES